MWRKTDRKSTPNTFIELYIFNNIKIPFKRSNKMKIQPTFKVSKNKM